MNAFRGQISAILWNVVNRPRIIDLVDIILMAIIVYELLIHVRQTRISQTFKGIAILLVATWLSGVLGMRSIHALLSWLINAGPVLLIVLFQSEFRRILAERGNSGMFDPSGRGREDIETETVIDELILALQNMSRRRVGALIVIEQKTRLNDIIATGTEVDGRLTQPLLENIFEPNTPLHDGAVIIRNNRVVAATCYLPLTGRNDLNKDLGTRHRAAVGISEVSDSMTLVVSEENGQISIAHGGTLYENLDVESLRSRLSSLQSSKNSQNKKGRKAKRIKGGRKQ